jgi:hypothetical protein
MRAPWTRRATGGLMALALTALLAGQAWARTSPAPAGAMFTPNLTWASILKLPKLWGIGWKSPPQYDAKVITLDQIDYPPLKPQFLAQSQAKIAEILAGKAEFKQGACTPNGVSRSVWYAYPPTFLFQPGDRLFILVIGEAREVFMDGRPHPAKIDSDAPNIKYAGHSVGWWEGETLVVDTVGVNPRHELYYGVPNGGGMHVVERYRLLDPKTLEVVLTVEDPRVLAKPWVFRKTYDAGPGGGGESSPNCVPSDSRQKVDAKGNIYLDLTPPPPGH